MPFIACGYFFLLFQETFTRKDGLLYDLVLCNCLIQQNETNSGKEPSPLRFQDTRPKTVEIDGAKSINDDGLDSPDQNISPPAPVPKTLFSS